MILWSIILVLLGSCFSTWVFFYLNDSVHVDYWSHTTEIILNVIGLNVYSVPRTWIIQFVKYLMSDSRTYCEYSFGKYSIHLREEGEDPAASLWYPSGTLSPSFGFKFDCFLQVRYQNTYCNLRFNLQTVSLTRQFLIMLCCKYELNPLIEMFVMIRYNSVNVYSMLHRW
jgi:hypothetical protein